jgi:hypothetical protein
MHIEKFYFTLPEVLERWSISESDLVYLAENDVLRLSVRVYDLPIKYRPSSAEPSRRPRPRRKHAAGLLDLHAVDVFNLFRCGEINAYDFRCPKLGNVSVPTGDAPVFVMIGDLLIRREERDRFEAARGFRADGRRLGEPAFIASPDYQDVSCTGHRFRLGPIQAEVVRALHEATLAGDPWQNGKAILSAARSRSLRMADVFKSQKNWRELICSNRRGKYRLKLD